VASAGAAYDRRAVCPLRAHQPSRPACAGEAWFRSLVGAGALSTLIACGTNSVSSSSGASSGATSGGSSGGTDRDGSVDASIDGSSLGDATGPRDGESDAGFSSGEGGAPVAWVSDPASLVNTLIGTTAGGNMFPGADVPFGMLQWSPDTSPDRSPGGGYEHNDTQIIGFSLTHLSGPGCGLMGDIPILPMTGGLPSGDPGAHTEPLSHAGEVGTAGYYSVQSGSPAITTELTATLHSGMARFTFPATRNANVLIKLLASENGNVGSSATVVGTNEVKGSTRSGFFCKRPTDPQYTLYFDVVFDRPFVSSQTITPTGKSFPGEVFLTFDTTFTQIVQAKVGISFVSTDNARANWNAENAEGTWDFAGIESAAKASWNTMLGQIQVAGGTAQENELFYTALYRSLLHPNVFGDTSGQYMGFDNQVHSVSGGQKEQYANYSGWDIYHSQVQLSAVVAPKQMSDSAQSMLNDAAQNGGMLPKWSLANGETYDMVGDPADGILAGYYAFGARAFDTATALKVMVAEATTPNNIRPGLQYYTSIGYLPDDGTYGCCHYYGSVATLLEYCQADFALSQFAAALGDMADAKTLLARSQSWQNVFDPSTNFFTARRLDGTFVAGVGLTTLQGMVEGSASQYRWALAFDRRAQIAAMGGAAAVNPMLDAFYSNLNDTTGKGALFSNEFELGAQYWDTYTGQPWKTQDVANRLRTQVYTDTPSYMNNNDDLGALSSQLVWSMMGLFPAYPGSPILIVNGPEFSDVLIHLPSGNSLAIHAEGASAANPYIQSLQVGGQATTRLWLDPSIVDSGSRLDFTMGATPNTSLGTAASDAPPSYGWDAASAIGFAAPSPLVVAPGATAEVTIGAQSARDDVSESMAWSAASTGGVQVSPAKGTFSLTPGGQATQDLAVVAPAALGTFDIALSLSPSSGAQATPPSLVLPVIVAPAGSIWPYFNDVGVTDDAKPSAGNFDGAKYSYSAQALAAAGVTPGGALKVGSITYTWPQQEAGTNDDIWVAGQTITVGSAAGKTTLGLLGAAANAGSGGAQGTLTVRFADGSTQPVPFTFSEWTLNAGTSVVVPENAVAARCAYRNARGGKDSTATYLFSFSATLSSSQPVTSIVLPQSTSGGDAHLFAIALD
jgi:predicted alpha-1,2-mannosidase